MSNANYKRLVNYTPQERIEIPGIIDELERAVACDMKEMKIRMLLQSKKLPPMVQSYAEGWIDAMRFFNGQHSHFF